MTYSINWPITVRSVVPFRSGNYIFPLLTNEEIKWWVMMNSIDALTEYLPFPKWRPGISVVEESLQFANRNSVINDRARLTHLNIISSLSFKTITNFT